jgi:hypothetical protein
MALMAGRRAACGGCELARARGHLERAVAELELARLAWGVWADGVRQLAEQATGVSVAEGFALFDDAGYARALGMGAAYDDAADAAGAALAAAGAGVAGEPADCPCLAVKTRIGSPHP